MNCYGIEKSEIQKKKGPQINMAPTLNIFGFVSRFLYSGGWQVCYNSIKHETNQYFQRFQPKNIWKNY